MSEVEVNLQVRPDLEPGVYANLAAVWHTQFDFTLDFAVLGLPEDVEGKSVIRAPVVARVKIPTSVIFQIAQAIATNVDNYEREFGRLTPPPNEHPGMPQ